MARCRSKASEIRHYIFVDSNRNGFVLMELRELCLSLPMYTNQRSPKMLGLNWYGTCHFRERGNQKKLFTEEVGKILPKNFETLKSPIKVSYDIYYKNVRSDGGNIIGVVDKFVMDAFQELGVIEEDNVKHYVESTWKVIGQDRKEPRVIITVEELGEDI